MPSQTGRTGRISSLASPARPLGLRPLTGNSAAATAPSEPPARSLAIDGNASLSCAVGDTASRHFPASSLQRVLVGRAAEQARWHSPAQPRFRSGGWHPPPPIYASLHSHGKCCSLGGASARCASPLLHLVQACALFRRRGSVECISASSSTLPPSRPSALRAAASSFSPSVGQLHSHRHGDPRRSQSQHSALSNTRRTFVACLRIESQQP